MFPLSCIALEIEGPIYVARLTTATLLPWRYVPVGCWANIPPQEERSGEL